MPADRSSGRSADHPDSAPDLAADRIAAARPGPDAPARLTERRSRAEAYRDLRAIESDPLGRRGWDSPELADHPDRPAPDSIRITQERAIHILDGDATGGGHRHGTGRPGKTEFPARWDDQKIMDGIMCVARSPDAAQLQRNGRWMASGSHDDVRLAVIIRPGGEIWAAYPLPGSPGVTKNPRNR